jgi:acetyl esterase/lipase
MMSDRLSNVAINSRARWLTALAVGCSSVAFGLTIWIVLPAPFFSIWLLSIVVGEWSLYVGALGFVGLGLGSYLLVVRRTSAASAMLDSATLVTGKSQSEKILTWLRCLAVVLGLSSVGLSLYPLLVCLPVAAHHAVHLSLSRYLWGETSEAIPAETFVYSQVDHQTLSLDVYRASVRVQTGSTKQRLHPAVIVIHGGAWRSGSRSDFPQWNQWLRAQSYVVVDIDYRLAPQPNSKTALADVEQAVIWVKQHAQKFEIDPDKIVLYGRSAGGHLALLAAYSAHQDAIKLRDRSIGVDTFHHQDAIAGKPEFNATVKAVIAFYSPTDLTWSYSHPANLRVINGPATLRAFTGGTPDLLADVYQQASPIAQINAATARDLPWTLLIHGGQDQLVRKQNSERLLQRIHSVMDVAAPVRSVDASGENSATAVYDSLFIPYAQHGFDYHFDGWGSQISRAVILRFLNARFAEKANQ